MVGAGTAGGYCCSAKRPRPAVPARAPAPARCKKFRLEKPVIVASESSNRPGLYLNPARARLPLGHRPVFVKSAGHRLGAAKRVLGQAPLAQLEPPAGSVAKRKAAIHPADC